MGCDISSVESFIIYWLKQHLLGKICSLLYYGCKGHFKLPNASSNNSGVDKSNLLARTLGKQKLQCAAQSLVLVAEKPE